MELMSAEEGKEELLRGMSRETAVCLVRRKKNRTVAAFDSRAWNNGRYLVCERSIVRTERCRAIALLLSSCN